MQSSTVLSLPNERKVYSSKLRVVSLDIFSGKTTDTALTHKWINLFTAVMRSSTTKFLGTLSAKCGILITIKHLGVGLLASIWVVLSMSTVTCDMTTVTSSAKRCIQTFASPGNCGFRRRSRARSFSFPSSNSIDLSVRFVRITTVVSFVGLGRVSSQSSFMHSLIRSSSSVANSFLLNSLALYFFSECLPIGLSSLA